VSIRGFRQIEQVTQRLVFQPNATIPEDVVQRLRARTVPSGARLERLLSESSAMIQGIPIPSIYRITLSGHTEAGAFDPFTGKLLVYPSQQDIENPLYLLLVLDGPGRNGYLTWSSEESDIRTPGLVVSSRIRLEHGRIEASIRGEGSVIRLLSFLRWITLEERRPGTKTDVPVFAENGTLTLTIQHDGHVVGTISATGTSLGDTPQPSSYKADLTGEREGGSLLAAVTEDVGASRFAGRWVDATLGDIDLKRVENRVTGSYAGGAIRLTGIVQEDWLDFAWESDQAGKGQGFFRVLPGGGTLVGLQESSTASATFQAIVAVQPDAGYKLERIMRNPTPGDIRELKYLGYDLVSQGNCQQAVGILDTVVDYYKKQARASINEPMAQEDFLVS
jgi:hypothetical protein